MIFEIMHGEESHGSMWCYDVVPGITTNLYIMIVTANFKQHWLGLWKQNYSYNHIILNWLTNQWCFQVNKCPWFHVMPMITSDMNIRIVALDLRQHRLIYIPIIWASSWENLSLGFVTRHDSNQPAQLQRLVQSWNFWYIKQKYTQRL